MNREIIQRVYEHTRAIGWVPPDFDFKTIQFGWRIGEEIPFTIVGTGFFVRPNLVMTASHVALHLIKKLSLSSRQIVAATTTQYADQRGDIQTMRKLLMARRFAGTRAQASLGQDVQVL